MTRSVRSTTVVAGAALLLAACEPGTHVAEAGAIDTGRIVRARPAPPTRRLLPTDLRAAINARLNGARPAVVTPPQ